MCIRDSAKLYPEDRSRPIIAELGLHEDVTRICENHPRSGREITRVGSKHGPTMANRLYGQVRLGTVQRDCGSRQDDLHGRGPIW